MEKNQAKCFGKTYSMSYKKTQLNDIREKIHDQNELITKDIETVKRTQQIPELKNSVNEDRIQENPELISHRPNKPTTT